MLRATFDRLLSYAALLLAALLLVVSGLAFWGYSFANGTVSDQLSAQKITMPAGAAIESLPAEDQAALARFAGQPLNSGDAAKVYADNYIQVHMDEAGVNTPGVGKAVTYSEASGLCRALPQAEQAASPLCALRTTLFQGDTLRSILLTTYAFGTIAKIALVGAIVTLVAGIGLAILATLGLRHAAKVGDAPLDAAGRRGTSAS